MDAVDRPYPDLDAAALAVRHEVGTDVILARAKNVNLQRFEVAGKGKRPAVHDASGAKSRQLGKSLSEGVNLLARTEEGNDDDVSPEKVGT